LKPEARKRALQKIQDSLEIEPELLTEYFQTLLDDRGLPGLDCYWSLSCCQGDGVAFYGKLDIDALLACEACKAIHPELRYLQAFGVGFKIIGANNRYHHWNSMAIEDDFTSDPQVEKLIEERADFVKAFLLEYVKQISKELEKVGYDDIEYQTSETQALERAKELMFLENGIEFDEESNQA
jgi:hypothetical protein